MVENFRKWLRIYRKKSILVFCLLVGIIFISVGSYCVYATEVKSDVVLVDNQVLEQKDNVVSVSSKVRVDIKGQVVSPGVYEVGLEDRVIDVISLAGGLLDNADTSFNNLSRKVKDEMVIIIYSKDEVNDFGKVSEDNDRKFESINNSNVVNDAVIWKSDIDINQDNSTVINDDLSKNTNEGSVISSKVSINTGTIDELTTLSGIGTSKAQAIIDYRNNNGVFKTIEEILNVSGIGEKLFEKIKDNITL